LIGGTSGTGVIFRIMVKNSPMLRVLIVEDEMLIRWSIVETLGRAGFDVVEAENGAAAIQALSNPAEPVDAIVLDLRLPDSNDLSLLKRIRAMSPETPVIMMTAFGTPEVTRGATELGVYEVLHKPFEMHALEAHLRSACGPKPPVRAS
jgi:DNA-binding NtrC family response regulator